MRIPRAPNTLMHPRDERTLYVQQYIIRTLRMYSLLCSALYAQYRYYVVHYVQSVLVFSVFYAIRLH